MMLLTFDETNQVVACTLNTSYASDRINLLDTAIAIDSLLAHSGSTAGVAGRRRAELHSFAMYTILRPPDDQDHRATADGDDLISIFSRAHRYTQATHRINR